MSGCFLPRPEQGARNSTPTPGRQNRLAGRKRCGPATRGRAGRSSRPGDRHQRQIVPFLSAGAEGLEIAQTGRDQVGGLVRRLPGQEAGKTVDAVFLAGGVARLVDPVGVEEDGIPRRQPQPGHREARVARTSRSECRSRRSARPSLPRRDERRNVSGLQISTSPDSAGAAEDERGEVARQGALAEQAARSG